jgi:Bacterial Ig domain/Bacterial Ig-like domain
MSRLEIQITVGRFALHLGSTHGTIVHPAPTAERVQTMAVADAVAGVPVAERPSASRALSDAVARAEEVTAGVERANDLITALAKGLTLDPKVLEKEANALLDLLDRADGEGRWEDERRLARALVTLLALIPRWVALIEVLRRTASAAAAVGDRATQAWAHHEIGTFGLAADDLGIARGHLTQALELRNSLGDTAGANVSFHNLRMFELAEPVSELRTHHWRTSVAHHPLVAGFAALVILATAGGFVGARSREGSRDDASGKGPNPTAISRSETLGTTSATAAPSDSTKTTQPGDTTTHGSGTTTEEGDRVEPFARLATPSPFVSEVISLSASATDSGGSGLDAVTFEIARSGTDAWQALGRDAQPPYALAWDTQSFADGRYDLRVTAADGAGNEHASAVVQTVVDNNAPTIYLGDVPDSAFGTIKLSAKAVDGDGSGIESVVFELARSDVELGGTAWEEIGTATEVLPFEVEFDTTAKRDGLYTLRAKAFDRAGNIGISKPASFEIQQPEP